MESKKVMSLLLAASIIGAVSCGTEAAPDDSTQDSTPTSVSDTSTIINDNLPQKDYGGYDFRILMRCAELWTQEMFSDELNGDVINDAVFLRNQAVSERFSVNFKLVESSDSGFETDGKAAILAGEDAYDVIAPHAQASFLYANDGLCLDWKTELPYVDLNQSWWDQDAKNSFEINGKLYMMVGDLSYMALAESDCVLFNKNLFDKYNEEYPYQKVLDGTWTFDELTRLAKTCAEDLNGDGKMSPDDDRFGFVTYVWTGPIWALYSGGGRTLKTDNDGKLELCVNTERNIDVMTTFFDLVSDKSCYMEDERTDYQSQRRDIFYEGRALLIDGSLLDVSYMRGMSDDFGIVPCPKFDETCDRYYTNVDAGTNLYIVPITASDAERTSIILEALSAEGSQTVIPAYYEVALQGKYTRDDLSVQMIDMIKETRIFDTGYYINHLDIQFGVLGRSLAARSDHNFSSFYAEREAAAQAAIDKINETYGK